MPNLDYIEVLLRDPEIETLEGSAKFAGVTAKLLGFHSKLVAGKQLNYKERVYVHDVIEAIKNIDVKPLTINGEVVDVRFGAPLAPWEHYPPQILEEK